MTRCTTTMLGAAQGCSAAAGAFTMSHAPSPPSFSRVLLLPVGVLGFFPQTRTPRHIR